MSASFTFRAPTEVHFGLGVISEIPLFLAKGRWGLLTSPSMSTSASLRALVDPLAGGGVTVVPIGTVSPNPRLSEVEAAFLRASEARVDGILAVGGGSVIDAAKLLRIAVQGGVSARTVLYDLPAALAAGRGGAVPLVVVPSTAGTGAEVSKGAIISDDTAGTKTAARGEALIPDIAFIDPGLAVTMPGPRSAEVGFDIITHAVETYLSLAANRMTDQFALAALRETPGALLRVLEDPNDLSARETLAFQSLCMGYNLAHASTCLPHRMQYPVGAMTNTGHQAGLAALYPAWAAAVETAAPHRAQAIVAALAAEPRLAGKNGLAGTLTALLDGIGLRPTLTSLGIGRTMVAAVVEGVTGRIDLDPLRPDTARIEALIVASL